jgi:hypothetical protein
MINVVENLGPGLRQVKQGGVVFFYCTIIQEVTILPTLWLMKKYGYHY